MRCFVAIELPEEVRREARKIQEELKRLDLDAKWVEFENLHITLKFLGEVKESFLSQLEEVISHVTSSTAPFRLRLSEVGGSPQIRRPRVLWLGVEAPDVFLKMIEYLDEEFSKLGLPPERRKPHPHITLARLRSFKNVFRLKEKIENLSFQRKDWLTDSVVLFRSILTPSGPVYEKIFSKTFTP